MDPSSSSETSVPKLNCITFHKTLILILTAVSSNHTHTHTHTHTKWFIETCGLQIETQREEVREKQERKREDTAADSKHKRIRVDK
jgi:hypothetical protein